MATALATVTVGRNEADQGWLITCSRCPRFRTMRRSRPAADVIASEHRASHQTTLREDAR